MEKVYSFIIHELKGAKQIFVCQVFRSGLQGPEQTTTVTATLPITVILYFMIVHFTANSGVLYQHTCNQVIVVLRFYGPVNSMGTYRAWSVYPTTFLLGRLSPLSN